MIEIFLISVVIVAALIYIKYRKKDYYFNYEVIDDKYNFVELNYIYYDSKNIIRKDKMIIPKSSAIEILEILEDCFNKNICIK